MAPVLSLAPVTVIAISHPVIALTLLMAKQKKNEKEMADFPFHYDVSQRAVETCGGGVSSKKGKVWGLCQFLSIFDTKYITVFLGWAADATVSNAAKQERYVLVRDFPRVLHLGFLTMVWYRVRISQACLTTMLLTWDASKKQQKEAKEKLSFSCEIIGCWVPAFTVHLTKVLLHFILIIPFRLNIDFATTCHVRDNRIIGHILA